MTVKKIITKKPYRKRTHLLTALKIHRLKTNVGQREICLATGISRTRFSEYENGLDVPPAKTKAVLCAFFSISEDALFPPNEKV